MSSHTPALGTVSTLGCPHCGSEDVRTSHRQSAGRFHTVYRCRSCKRHFKISTSRFAMLGTVLAAVAALVLIVMGVIWALNLQAARDSVSHAPVTLGPEVQADLDLARKGDADAQYRVGRYFWGRDDYHRGFQWIKAAAMKNAEAKYHLGLAFLAGRGTVQNYRSALEQFEEASRLGNLEAQYQLGIMYRDGLGVQRNRELAYTWLNVAAARGHLTAGQYRNRLSDLMSAEETNRAQEASMQELARMHAIAAEGASVRQ
jgi:hypothetical protein